MKRMQSVYGAFAMFSVFSIGTAYASNHACPSVSSIVESADGTHYSAPGAGAQKWEGENPMARPGSAKKLVFHEAYILKNKQVACDYLPKNGEAGGVRMTWKTAADVTPQSSNWIVTCRAADPLACQFKKSE